MRPEFNQEIEGNTGKEHTGNVGHHGNTQAFELLAYLRGRIPSHDIHQAFIKSERKTPPNYGKT